MNRIAMFSLALSLAVAPRVWAVEPMPEQAKAIAPSPALSIRITQASELPRLTVVVKNEGKTELRLFEPEESVWGWNNLAFCAGMKTGGMLYINHSHPRGAASWPKRRAGHRSAQTGGRAHAEGKPGRRHMGRPSSRHAVSGSLAGLRGLWGRALGSGFGGEGVDRHGSHALVPGARRQRCGCGCGAEQSSPRCMVV